MSFTEVVIRILFILLVPALMAVPILINYLSLRRDARKGISFKRFRLVIFSLVYFVAAIILIRVLKDTIYSVLNIPFVKTVATWISIPRYWKFCVTVIITVAFNIVLGLIYNFIEKLTRIGMKRSNPNKKIIKYFNNESWFLAAKALLWFALLVSAAFYVMYILFFIPLAFRANFIPYRQLRVLFRVFNMVPMLALLVIWEFYFFLRGIELNKDEIPDAEKEEGAEAEKEQYDIELINSECKKFNANRTLCEIRLPEVRNTGIETKSPLIKMIGDAVVNKRDNAEINTTYNDCLAKLTESDDNLIISGSLFSEFGQYFIRYAAMILAKGENMIFVCNSDDEVEAAYEYLKEGFKDIASIETVGIIDEKLDFKHPIWGIAKVTNNENDFDRFIINDQSVLVTTIEYLCSNSFESLGTNFVELTHSVVFIDALDTVTYNYPLMSMFNTRLLQIAKRNVIASKDVEFNKNFKARYVYTPVRYICFDTSMVAGLDKVLNNILSVSFKTTDCFITPSETIASCYSYEGRADSFGQISNTQFIETDEEIGPVVNMALICKIKGAPWVSLLAGNRIPAGAVLESVASNAAGVGIAKIEEAIKENHYAFDQNDYSVIMFFDNNDNLPDAIRRGANIMGNNLSLVNIFSRPYLFRDYYVANIEELWNKEQTVHIPIQEATAKDAAIKILVKANAGGITEAEVWEIAGSTKKFEALAKAKRTNDIFVACLDEFGIDGDGSLFYQYFEYNTVRDFDENGSFIDENRIHLRRRGKLFDILKGGSNVRLVNADNRYIMRCPKERITQNYIEGQNLLYNGEVYYISNIDIESGIIYGKLATAGANDDAFEYVQSRHYYISDSSVDYQPLFLTDHYIVKEMHEGYGIDEIFVNVFKAPMEVVTEGYFVVDPHTMDQSKGFNKYVEMESTGLSKKYYRRYGIVSKPYYTAEQIIDAGGHVYNDTANMMSIRFKGTFGENKDRVTYMLSVLLNEVVKTMFPYVKEGVAVLPVLSNAQEIYDAHENLSKIQPKLNITEGEHLKVTDDVELIIVEDSATDLGVISTLKTYGDNIFAQLFGKLFKYLEWEGKREKNKAVNSYIYYGSNDMPECFDFDGVLAITKMLGASKIKTQYVEMDPVVEYKSCAFCGSIIKNDDDAVYLQDGRCMCKTCATTIIGNDKKELAFQLNSVCSYLESIYGIDTTDIKMVFDSTVKAVNTIKSDIKHMRGGSDIELYGYYDTEKGDHHVERDIPKIGVRELIVRQLTYAWQLKNIPTLEPKLSEGLIAIVDTQYLTFAGYDRLADIRTNYYESSYEISAIGYREIAKQLIRNPGYGNNPFAYLLDISGIGNNLRKGGEDEEPNPGNFYSAQTKDRNLDGTVSYFYYNLLDFEEKSAYEKIYEALKNHEDTVTIPGYDMPKAEKVIGSVEYDHPELFYYKTFSIVEGVGEIRFSYVATKEQAESIMESIEAVIPEYLKGITDEMSGYDVAMRVHNAIVNMTDYDTVTLNKEKAEGRNENEIDYIRTICGVFLNHKAVCAGYAAAMQLLLQRCGMEIGVCAGFITKSGGGHAWNIVKLDGEYYLLDTTWDDASDTIQTVKDYYLNYAYFMVTTEEMTRTRDFKLTPSVGIPACTSIKCNYHFHNNLILDSYDLSKISAIVSEMAGRGETHFTVKCANERVYKDVLNKLCLDGRDMFKIMKDLKRKKINLGNRFSYRYDNNMYVISVIFKNQAK